MKILLERFAYMENRTMGQLHIQDHTFLTIERPWISSLHHKGGRNFESCVPDGEYSLLPFESEAHPESYILKNEELDVFADNPGKDKGRWSILIHVGNYVKDVVGCIAPGLTGDESHVWESRKAMARIRELLGREEHVLVIQAKGAKN